jgi:hypothetical protein
MKIGRPALIINIILGIVNTPNLNFPCGIVRENNGNFYVVQQVDAPGGKIGSVVKMTAH